MPSSTRRLIPDMTKPNSTTKYSWAQNVVIMIILASFYSTVLWILVRRVWFYIKMFICCLLHNIGSIAMRKKSPIIWTATKFQQYSAIMLSVKQPWLNVHVKWFSCYWRPFLFFWFDSDWRTGQRPSAPPRLFCRLQLMLSPTRSLVLAPETPFPLLTSDRHKQLILFDYVPTNFSFLSLSKWGSFHDFIHLERETAYSISIKRSFF